MKKNSGKRTRREVSVGSWKGCFTKATYRGKISKAKKSQGLKGQASRAADGSSLKGGGGGPNLSEKRNYHNTKNFRGDSIEGGISVNSSTKKEKNKDCVNLSLRDYERCPRLRGE